jgi:membrane protease YdiL (CAAX protease family)
MTRHARDASPSAWRSAAVDLLLWVVAYVVSVALKAVVLVGVLGIDPQHIPYDDFRIYLVQFLTPVVVLSALTLVLRYRGQTWKDLGMRSPASWRRFVLVVFATAVATLVITYGARALPALFGGNWPPSDFAAVGGNRAALISLSSYTILAVGITEEFMMRGFVMSRVAAALGETERAWRWSAVVVGIGFGLMHVQHGALTVLAGAVIGVLYGFVYLWSGRNLWVVAASHSLHDTVRVVGYFVT